MAAKAVLFTFCVSVSFFPPHFWHPAMQTTASAPDTHASLSSEPSTIQEAALRLLSKEPAPTL